jgi:transcriptional regulator with XRE-family HTH domain
MGTRESRAQRGKRRGRAIVAVALAQLRAARLAAGISQAVVAAGLGWSQQHYSRFEGNRLRQVSFGSISVAAALLGLEPSLTFFPAGPALRDAGHQTLIARLIALLSPAWKVAREASFPNPGDPRSWDVLLRLGNYLAGIEAETRIRDMQALVRRMRERARQGGTEVIVIVLSDTSHNRALVDDLRTALGDEFAASPRALVRALRTGIPLPGSGVVLL